MDLVFPTNIDGNTWYHLVFNIRSDSVLSLYLNGELKDLNFVRMPLFSSDYENTRESNFIGTQGSNYMKGNIKYIRVWKNI